MESPVWDETCRTGELMAVALESPRGQGAGTGCVGAGRRHGAVAAAPAASGGGASRCACRAAAGSLWTGPGTPGTACPAPAATGLGLAAKVSPARRRRVPRACPAQRRRGWALPQVGVWAGRRTCPGAGGNPGRPPLPPQQQRRRRRRTSWKRIPRRCSRAEEEWAGGRPLGASPVTAGRCCSTARRGRSQPRAQPRAWRRRG